MLSTTPNSIGEARVESASKVHTGTVALASILANMQEKRRREIRDPFMTPFDDEHYGQI